jgi:AAA15 family ATPase/GTPase
VNNNTVFGTYIEAELSEYTKTMLYNEQIRITDIIRLLNNAGIDRISGIVIKNSALTKAKKAIAELLTDTTVKLEELTGPAFDYDENSTKEIMFAHDYNKEYFLPFLSESMGTRRFFDLTGPLLDCIHYGKALFIDEIESSLHDDLLEFFIRAFLENTKESQLLFTTHNQNLLDSALLRNDEVWFAQKDDDGGSDFFSLAEFKDVPENVSRRDLYKAGAFGALPRTSRFYRE